MQRINILPRNKKYSCFFKLKTNKKCVITKDIFLKKANKIFAELSC